MFENKKQLRKAILGFLFVILGSVGQYYTENSTTEVVMAVILGLGIGILIMGLFLENRIEF